MKQKIKSKRDFDDEVYMRLGHDQLVTLAVKFVLESGKIPTLENIVEEAYLCFPHRFCMQGHSEWPHSLVVNRAILRCTTDRKKRWLSGKAASGYKLMPEGQTIADDTYQKLHGEKPLSKSLPKAGKQTPSARVVKYIEGSTAFQKYQRDKKFDAVTDYDLCDLLYCTAESTVETFENNISVFVSAVEDFEREDLLPFLDGLRQKFPSRFYPSTESIPNPK
jgi:hypothetical protein